MEPGAKVEPGSGKHSVSARTFRRTQNSDICLKTKITRASCRRRAGTVVPRADHFGELITADHIVLSEGSESRNNHRCGVVVQDLATQWIQFFPCKTKTSQETQKGLQKYVLAVFMTRDVEGLGSIHDEGQSYVVHHFLNCTASLAIPRLLADTVLTRLHKKNFSGNTKELAEVLGADQETKSHLHCHSFGIGKACEELTCQRRTDRKRMGLLRKRCAELG